MKTPLSGKQIMLAVLFNTICLFLDERLFINPAIELLTLFSGKQFSFGEVYKLSDEKEFTGAWVSQDLG